MPPERPHHRFWPEGVPREIPVPATSLWQHLADSAARAPERIALVFFGRELRYRELEAQAERLAGTLHALGVGRGDRVVLDMQNCPQLVIAHFAILRANAVVVPVNPMNRAAELGHFIADSGARVALTTGDLAAELAAASAALPPGQRLAHMIVTQFTDAFDGEAEGEEAPLAAWRDWLVSRHPLPSLPGGTVLDWPEATRAGRPVPALEIGACDMAVLPYTSGTTGLPKGCVHLHASLAHNARAARLWGAGDPWTAVLAVVPMFHISGMVGVMHAAIFAGATLLVMPRWERAVAGRLISRRRATSWNCIPTMVIDLLASPDFASFDLGSLLRIGGGGAPMPQVVAQQLLERYGLVFMEGYGLTETAGASHANPAGRCKQQCLGIPHIGTDSRVVDPDTLREMPQGETGEIVTHGPGVFAGYWNRPDADRAAFVEIDGKRFFRTGDIGRVDEEGYFFMTDRLKRMINASGFKVWPAEVELLMFGHPAVQEACVIAMHDAYRGESVKAVVVRRKGHESTTAQEIIDWCRTHMAVYKCPRKVQFAEALPRSASGKVMWRLLQDAERVA